MAKLRPLCYETLYPNAFEIRTVKRGDLEMKGVIYVGQGTIPIGTYILNYDAFIKEKKTISDNREYILKEHNRSMADFVESYNVYIRGRKVCTPFKSKKIEIDPKYRDCKAIYINEPTKNGYPNCCFYEIHRRIVILTTSPIRHGDELAIWYGNDYGSMRTWELPEDIGEKARDAGDVSLDIFSRFMAVNGVDETDELSDGQEDDPYDDDEDFEWEESSTQEDAGQTPVTSGTQKQIARRISNRPKSVRQFNQEYINEEKMDQNQNTDALLGIPGEDYEYQSLNSFFGQPDGNLDYLEVPNTGGPGPREPDFLLIEEEVSQGISSTFAPEMTSYGSITGDPSQLTFSQDLTSSIGALPTPTEQPNPGVVAPQYYDSTVFPSGPPLLAPQIFSSGNTNIYNYAPFSLPQSGHGYAQHFHPGQPMMYGPPMAYGPPINYDQPQAYNQPMYVPAQYVELPSQEAVEGALNNLSAGTSDEPEKKKQKKKKGKKLKKEPEKQKSTALPGETKFNMATYMQSLAKRVRDGEEKKKIKNAREINKKLHEKKFLYTQFANDKNTPIIIPEGNTEVVFPAMRIHNPQWRITICPDGEENVITISDDEEAND